MGIIEVPTPAPAGRQPRISDEDLESLAESVKAGNWASDGEATPTKSAAYQRAQTAARLLGERFELVNIKTNATPVDPDDLTQGFTWAVGPRPAGEQPRRQRTEVSS